MPEIPPTTQTTGTAVISSPRHRSRRHALGYNVADVFKAGWNGGGAATSTGHRRVTHTVDPAARDISRVPPLPVIGFADGVQTQFLVRHVQHRPVSLVWVAAGAVHTPSATLLDFRQRLELVGSAADGAVLEGLSKAGRGLPVHRVEELTPWGVAVATQALVDEWRQQLEREVITDTPIPEGKHLIVDGSIRQHTREKIAGVIKTVDTQYLADESALPERAGWRSPVFGLPATTTSQRDVVSAYLRLHPAPGSTSWSHGLIRLEAHDPETLDAACALALRHRQSPGSGDPRWATHLEGMHRTEEVLKAFRHPFLEW